MTFSSTRPLRVYVLGDGRIPWAIGDDFHQLHAMLRTSDRFVPVRWHWQADVVHCVWWNLLLVRRYAWLRFWRKPLVAVASNFVALDNPQYDERSNFDRVLQHVSFWIAPSGKQQTVFQSHALRSARLPFVVDTQRYRPEIRRLDRADVAAQLGLDWSRLQGKVIIGSFQRDSLGADLSKPKWQKDPDLLIWLLRQMPRDRYVLLLAGPRRHYLLGKCKAEGIPYLYVGRETADDDIDMNITPQERMPLLYSLTDLYLVTSASEGGPKAILECVASGTPVLSTDVGLAADFLDSRHVCRAREQYAKTLHDLISSGTPGSAGSTAGRARLLEEMSPTAYTERLAAIYRSAIEAC